MDLAYQTTRYLNTVMEKDEKHIISINSWICSGQRSRCMIPSPLLAVRQFGLLQLEVEVLVVLHRFQVVAVPEGVSASSGKAQGAGEVNDKSLSEHSSNGSDSHGCY